MVHHFNKSNKTKLLTLNFSPNVAVKETVCYHIDTLTSCIKAEAETERVKPNYYLWQH